jgi:hypothetical protein
MHCEHQKHNINTYSGSQHNLSKCDDIDREKITENKKRKLQRNNSNNKCQKNNNNNAKV